MRAKYKITNEKTFYSKVADIDLSGLSATNHFNGNYHSFCANGAIVIELENGETLESSGQHGKKDFEEYGFELYCEDELMVSF